MSIYKISPSDIENFTISTNPNAYYASSSLGITGSLRVFPRSTHITHDTELTSSKNNLYFDESHRLDAGTTLTASLDNVQKYIAAALSAPQDNKVVNVRRLVPEYSGSSESNNYLKQTAVTTLMPYYSHMTNFNMSCTNYYCMSFVSASSLLTSSALLYYNDSLAFISPSISEEFSLSFRINVRNGYPEPSPGTVLQLTKNFSISVVSGTVKDAAGNCETYGLLFQGGVDDNPRNVVVNGDNIIKFNDVLRRNCWHHVVLNYDAKKTGKKCNLFVDGTLVSSFLENDFSLTPAAAYPILVLGNFYSGSSSQDFFTADSSQKFGVPQASIASGLTPSPPFEFSSPGYFDLHEVCMSRKTYGINPTG